MSKKTVLLLILVCGCPILAQGPSLHGTVTNEQGKPIEGVDVYVYIGQNKSKTTQTGQFQLVNPAPVIHFWKDSFQPQTLVVQPGTSELRTVLHPGKDTFNLPKCAESREGEERFGSHLMFSIRKRDFRISGRESDIDYVKYTVSNKRSSGSLVVWLGGQAAAPEPSDGWFTNVSSFSQQNVTFSGDVVGLDTKGQLGDEHFWRHVGVAGDGAAIYENVSQDDAKAFDQVIASLCRAPYRSETSAH
jgi:hypothetical protein